MILMCDRAYVVCATPANNLNMNPSSLMAPMFLWILVVFWICVCICVCVYVCVGVCMGVCMYHNGM